MSGSRMKAGTIEITGMKELRRELKKLDEPGLIDALKDVNLRVAEHVIDAAKSRAGTRLERRAAGTLQASRQAARAQVVGGKGFAGFGGAEFGAGQNVPRVGPSGRQFRGHNQFESWRGNGRDAGYFLYPAIRDETDSIVEMYGDEIDRITAEGFPD